jgi:hypothetical protein
MEKIVQNVDSSARHSTNSGSEPLERFSHQRNEEPPMKFALLGYGSEPHWGAMSEREQRAMLDACFTYDIKLMEDGHLLDAGAALQSSRTGKILRWENGAVVVTDGPYAETKEQLGGVGVLEARDMAHAVEFMSKHPGLNYGATFEIRPIDEGSLERRAASIAAMGGMPAVDPQATNFAGFGYINESVGASKSKSELDSMLKECIAFDEVRIKSGQSRDAIGLQSARSAKTLRANGGQVVVADGPYAETKEYLGGIVVLALPSLNDAVTMLSKHPALSFGVVMEIRPLNEEIATRWEAMRKQVERTRASR